MKCPMKFNQRYHVSRKSYDNAHLMYSKNNCECDPDCAWLVDFKDKPQFCAIVAIATNSLVQCGMTIEKEAEELCK